MTKTITKIDTGEQQLRASKLKVAAYCRVSTSTADQLISLDTQKAHYERYIRSNPEWDFAGIYYDEGISGTKKKERYGLQSLIQDCELGKIDLVLTKSISRFSRNTTDCLELVRKMIDLGVRIIFEKENIDTGRMESELMLSILSSMAEDESHSISQNMKWGIQKRFQDGIFKVSVPAFGYEKKGGEMVPNPEQAEVVKRIFEDSINGKSTYQVARELNEENVKTQRGGKWHSTTIGTILRNESYTGDALFQKTYTDDSFIRHINYGEKNMYLIENHHEAIISKETFELANRELERRAAEKGHKVGNGVYRNRYSFSGKIYCSECGERLKRVKHCESGRTFVLWSCKGHLGDKNSCSLKAIKDEDLKTAFLTMLNKLRFSREQILKPLMRSLQGFDDQENLLKISAVEQKLEKNIEQQKVLAQLMANGILETVVFTRERSRLTEEQLNLEKEKAELKQSVTGNRNQIDELRKLNRFLSAGEMLDEFNETLFEEFGAHINVYSRTEVEFVLKCGLKLREVL